MGIRVHKAIGYFTEPGRRAAADEKIWDHTKHLAALIEELVGDNAELRERLFLDYPRKVKGITYPENVWKVVQYARYPDEKNGRYVFMTPICFEQWFHYDDHIDYVEEAIRDKKDKGPKDRFTPYERPLYPYLHWMDPATGEKLRLDEPLWFQKQQRNELVPWVPDVVQVLATYLGFDWKTLRPGVAVWWS